MALLGETKQQRKKKYPKWFSNEEKKEAPESRKRFGSWVFLMLSDSLKIGICGKFPFLLRHMISKV